MDPLWRNPVTADSWKAGDFVIINKKNDTRRERTSNTSVPLVGVISEVSMLNRRESKTVYIDLPNAETKHFNLS